jgi:ArsR family metal-binding transcriptional regulator
LEWIVGRAVELSADEKTTKYAIKNKLTKKEYKIILHLFEGGKIEDILEKLNLDEKRANEILENGKKKIRSNLGKFIKI